MFFHIKKPLDAQLIPNKKLLLFNAHAEDGEQNSFVVLSQQKLIGAKNRC